MTTAGTKTEGLRIKIYLKRSEMTAQRVRSMSQESKFISCVICKTRNIDVLHTRTPLWTRKFKN